MVVQSALCGELLADIAALGQSMTGLPLAVDYFSQFRDARIDQYTDVMREYRPTRNQSSGYGWFEGADKINNIMRNIHGNLGEYFADLRIPAGFVTADKLIQSWRVFKTQLEGWLAEIDTISAKVIAEERSKAILISGEFDDHEFIPQPIIQVRAVNIEVLSAVDHTLSLLDDPKDTSAPSDPSHVIKQLFDRFHTGALQLKRRYGGRETLRVEDEYDVQDLLHTFLKLHFDDVRAEEYTPSYAGGSSRIDFIIPDHGIAIEVKKTRDTLKDKKIGDELIIDIGRYSSHPSVTSLYCLVYDPDAHIVNPRGLEADLSKLAASLTVWVKIIPSN